MQNDSESEEDESFRRAVGKRLRVMRAIREMSQDELAEAAGVSRNFISAIERGTQGLDAVRLRRLAVALRVKLADLLAEPDARGR